MKEKPVRISFDVWRIDHSKIKAFCAFKGMSIKSITLSLFIKAMAEDQEFIKQMLRR